MSGWGDGAARENRRDIGGYKSPWRQPTAESQQWQSPGHARMFHDGDDGLNSDPIGRGFTTKKKHGWWGKEEYFDKDGRKIG